MGRNDKYAPDISFEDLSTFVREHKSAYGIEAYVVLHFGTGPGGEDWAEVRLQTTPDKTVSASTPMARGPVKGKRISSIMSTLLHTVAQGFQELETNPWLWGIEKRKAVRGE